ncbi:helix-turn-helix domain-containing protein [Hufsiella ginkgonis]|uniref:Helix-turn-helix domain-containing protein n=1 Tax=Hufsiella ginkgonis TaxID=2695274 RepID=A0A7K1Y1B6_9SPHI|nr:helix-turn-helix transcriptional regulator [Hufsiella ginkgonis]MXV17040.1 helix-turn-helix domain-containing protein [Hufsiella ginkgonis]
MYPILLYNIFVIGGLFCGFITFLLLFFKGNNLFQNRLLSIVVFACAWYALQHTLTVTGWLADLPHFWRMGSPLYYLVPPCYFFYTRATLLGENAFRKRDWLHFIPAAVHFLELMPFYLKSTAEKRQIVLYFMEDFNRSYVLGSGYIPALWHYAVRPFFGLAYLLFLLWPILIRYRRRSHPQQVVTAGKYAWLVAFASFMTVMYSGLAVQTVFALQHLDVPNAAVTESRAPLYVMSLTFLGMVCYLLFYQEIFYVQESLSPASPAEENEAATEACVNEEQPAVKEKRIGKELLVIYAATIDTFMLQHKPFMRQGITVSELALEMGMQPRTLSGVLNQHYQQRFSDFINAYRIAHIKSCLETGKWKEFTLEGLAYQCGFTSRSTFFAAFKKDTGLSPTEYIKKIGKSAPAAN